MLGPQNLINVMASLTRSALSMSGRVTEERDILKKAAVYFAKTSG